MCFLGDVRVRCICSCVYARAGCAGCALPERMCQGNVDADVDAVQLCTFACQLCIA
jgi:hypothetical protein